MRRKPREDGATALYELYSADKRLLYVGISHRPAYRWREHARDRAWWTEVAHRCLIWFGTRAEALIVEQAAITTLGPKHNQTISPQSVPPPPGVTVPDLHKLNREYVASHRALMAAIYRAIDQGESNARIARSVDWSREYIARIRLTRVSQTPPDGPDSPDGKGEE